MIARTLSDTDRRRAWQGPHGAPAGAVRPRRAGRATVRGRPVHAAGPLAAAHRELSAPPRLRRGRRGRVGRRCAPRTARRRTARRRARPSTPRRPTRRRRSLVLLHDLGFIERRSQDTRRYLIALHRRAGPRDRAHHDGRRAAELARLGRRRARRCCAARACCARCSPPAPELAPLAAELRARLRDLEDEYRRAPGAAGRLESRTPARRCCATQLRGDQVIVVSNREPYIHDRGATAASSSSARRAAW